MLILSRKMDGQENIVIINNNTKERIVLKFRDSHSKASNNSVKICFEASRNYSIIRGEIENKTNHTSDSP